MNGLAVAPPGIGCRIGVSTSKYPFWFKKSRIVVVTLERCKKVFFTCGLTIKSTYR